MKSKPTERSVPHQRGRKQLLKAKRRGHKRARSMPIDAGAKEVEAVRHGEELDKENPKAILFG